jgi:hypothetical protein
MNESVKSNEHADDKALRDKQYERRKKTYNHFYIGGLIELFKQDLFFDDGSDKLHSRQWYIDKETHTILVDVSLGYFPFIPFMVIDFIDFKNKTTEFFNYSDKMHTKEDLEERYEPFTNKNQLDSSIQHLFQTAA